MKFEKFPKIGRLKRQCTITEKIDGTNAQIYFDEWGNMLVGSRKREIFPGKTLDNYGFAGWVELHRPKLFNFLGEGQHYGEWAGNGIQRNYGLDMKRFYLFNSFRFGSGRQEIPQELSDVGLDVVPVLYQGSFESTVIDNVMVNLKHTGSHITTGFDNPEGIIIYHHGTRSYSKITYKNDKGKWSS